MANNMIKFYRGLLGSLPTTGENGALYITTDEGAIYYGTGTGMKRLGDFIQVDAVANLPTSGANTSSLYYCVAENILAKWTGSEWKQVNKQPDIDTLKVQLGLGTMAYKSEVAEADLHDDLAAKINASTAANHSHANKDLLDTYTQTEADLADAVAKKHAHTFVESELNKIADGDVAKWNAAEQNAKDFATGLDNAMKSRVEALEAIDHDHSNKTVLDGITEAKVTAWDAAEGNAKAYAKEYADDLAGNYDAAGAAAGVKTELIGTDADAKEANTIKGAKAYADQVLVDAKAYADTAEADALAAAKEHANGLNTTMSARVDALEAIDHSHANAEELDKIAVGDKAKWDAMEQNAKDYADGLDEVMDGRVAALEAKFTGDDSVADQIEAAVAAEAALREAADTALQNQIGVASTDGVIATGLHADIERLESLVGDTKVSEAIATAVAAEAEIARAAEKANADAIDAIEADYLKVADKTELEGKITANANAIELLTNGVSAKEVDGVNDLIQYVKEHGTEVTGMKADIKANADAIDGLAIVATTGSWNDLEDKPFGEVAERVKVCEEYKEQYITIPYDDGVGKYKASISCSEASLSVGDVCTLTIDGEEKLTGVLEEFAFTDNYGGSRSYIGFGNKRLLKYSEPDTGELYYVGYSNDSHVYVYMKEGVSGLYTIYTEAESVKTIDPKYLPDDIARVADQNALAERVTAAEADIDALEGAVALKANAADLGTMAAEAATDYVKKADAAGYDDILTKTVAGTTYETIANADLVRGRVSALESDNTTNKAAIEQAQKDIDALEALPAAGITAQNIVDWNDAVAKEHEHGNKTVIDGITADKVAAWDAAQANVIETVKVNGVALSVVDKAVDVTVPTGALASKDKVAEADLADALATKINAKADASTVYTKEEVDALLSWGSF